MVKVKIGCCGFSYFMPKKRFGDDWKKRFSSTVSAYASLFSLVEINSTFYNMPKISTVKKWFEEARKVNKNFEFTVKANQIITHKSKFKENAFSVFEKMKEICKALNARIMLMQTPASFSPTNDNIKAMKDFFKNIERDDIIIALELRGKWLEKPKIIKSLCKELDIINCVDPLRNEPQYFGKANIAYLRLHGFGKPLMYNYTFSDEELEKVKEIILSLKCKECYVLFNNFTMYDDALRFSEKFGLHKKDKEK